MIWLLLGSAAFIFLLLFDIGKIYGKYYAPIAFWLGGGLLGIATVGLVLPVINAQTHILKSVSGIMALVCLLALLYTLFFALPAKNTYSGLQRQSLCKSGLYALCRHPAAWWLLFMYLFLWLYGGTRELLVACILFPLLNLLYIWVQDRYLFPRYIDGYSEYKHETPFLFPTGKSINAFLKRGNCKS